MKNNNKALAGLAAMGLWASVVATGVQAAGPALKPGNEYLAVANNPGQIHVLDLATDSLYKSCDIPAPFGPGALIMAPDQKTAYVLANHYEDIYGINLDDCSVSFQTTFSQGNIRTKSMYGFALSPDGSQLYVMQNPTQLNNDHYRVQPTRIAVYNTADGEKARPVRTIPAPRQVTVMVTGKDGSLYLAGADIYRMDVETGKYETVIPSRNWQRPNYLPPDVLNVWPIQTPQGEFTILYTTARMKPGSDDINEADFLYGYMNVDLASGETETRDFGPLTEVYFTGMRSPKDPNLMFGVLNRLAKYDIREQKLLKAASLEHSYYCIAMNGAGSKVYLAGTFNDVAVFDADSLEQIGKVKLPGGDMATATSQVFVR